MSGARHFEQLVIWQLADAVRVEVLKLTARRGFAGDFKLRSQGEDAINSVCRNISEGFGCETHREFARFLRISRRSLNEVQDVFTGALEKGHVTPTDLVPARMLMRRIYPAFSRFIAYLDRTPDYRHRPSAKPTQRLVSSPTDKPQQGRTDKRQNVRTDGEGESH